jgi:hypothetical protein
LGRLGSKAGAKPKPKTSGRPKREKRREKEAQEPAEPSFRAGAPSAWDPERGGDPPVKSLLLLDPGAPPANPRRLLLGNSQILEITEENRPTGPLIEEPPRRLRRAARRYWREVLRKVNFLFSKGALNRVRWRGDRLLDEAGHWTEAAKALRFTWENDLRKGHTGDIWDAKWEKFIASDLLQYLRTQMYQGARVR